MRRLTAAALAAATLAGTACAASAAAATRTFTVTDFDRLRMAGAYAVELRTGGSPSARAEGTQEALDRLRVESQGRTLVVQPDRTLSTWRGKDRVRIVLTTPGLIGATVTGAGTLTIDRVKAMRFDLTVTGAGDVAVGALAADRLVLTSVGAGTVALAGKVAAARIVLQGAGALRGDDLSVADADLVVSGAAGATLGVTRAAKVDASGAGDVTILGSPACQVTSSGVGEVSCGGAGRR